MSDKDPADMSREEFNKYLDGKHDTTHISDDELAQIASAVWKDYMQALTEGASEEQAIDLDCLDEEFQFWSGELAKRVANRAKA